MKVYLLLIIAAFALSAHAQSPAWKIEEGGEIYKTFLSPDSNYLVYMTEKENAECVDVRSGKKLWTRHLKEYSEKYHGRVCGKFPSKDFVLLANENKYEFVKLSDGSVATSLPIIGESWEDIEINEPRPDEKEDTVRPYYIGDLGIFYFDEGFQILDLKEQKLLYQTACNPSRIKYQKWGEILMMIPKNNSDTVFFLDSKNKKMLYRLSLGNNSLNSSLHQHFCALENNILLFTEDNMLSINVPTQRIEAIIPIDPDDPDNYFPVINKEHVYLLVSEDDKQRYYDGHTGAMLWETKENVIPGVADQMTPLENDEALIFTYQSDRKMFVTKVNSKNGTVLWRTGLFHQDGNYEPGYKEGSKLLGTLAAVAIKILTQPRSTSFMNSSAESWSRYQDGMARSNMWAQDLYNSVVNIDKKTEGYAKMLSCSKETVMIAMGGKIYTDLQPTKGEDYDGEGVVTINLKDGSIASKQLFPIIAEADLPAYNAFSGLESLEFPAAGAYVIPGANDVYIVKGQDVERFAFGKEVVKKVSVGTKDVVFRTFDDSGSDDIYNYWSINPSPKPAKKTLFARTELPVMAYNDSVRQLITLSYKDNTLAAYKSLEGDFTEQSFSTPIWKLDEKALDNLDLGGFEENDSASLAAFAGVWVH